MSSPVERCARCGSEINVSIVSRFNGDVICMTCSEKERAHPRYTEAVAREEEEIRRGNLNFPGIGKPSDL